MAQKKGQIELEVKVNGDKAAKDAKNIVGNLKSQFMDAGSLIKGFFAGAVVAGLKAIADEIVSLGKEAAQFKSIQNAFEAMAKGAGASGQKMLAEMRAGVQGTVSDMELMKEANKAMMAGLDMSKVGEMMNIALAASKATGQEVSTSVEMILGGMAEQKTKMLEQVGIYVDAAAANDKYAASLGISAEMLTEAQKKQAFFTAAMDAGNKMAQTVGTKGILPFNLALQKSAAEFENLKLKITSAALPALSSLYDVMQRTMASLKPSGLGLTGSDGMEAFFNKIGAVIAWFGGFFMGQIKTWTTALDKLKSGFNSIGNSMTEFAEATKAALAGDKDGATAHLRKMAEEAGKAKDVLGELAIDVGTMGLTSSLRTANTAAAQFNENLKNMAKDSNAAGQNLGRLGSTASNSSGNSKLNSGWGGGTSSFKGFGIKEAGGKIDEKMPSMGKGFGEAALSTGQQMVSTIYDTWKKAGDTELELMKARHEKAQWFSDTLVQIAMSGFEKQAEAQKKKQEEESARQEAAFAQQLTALQTFYDAQQALTEDQYARGDISAAEKDARDKTLALKKQNEEKALKEKQAKEAAELQKRQAAESDRIAQERAAKEKELRKAQALIGWISAVAQLESTKRIQSAQVTIQGYMGATAALAQNVALLGPFGIASGLAMGAMILAQSQMSRAAIQSQVALPPAELFLKDGGIVMPKPGGVRATIAEAGIPEAVIPLDGHSGGLGNNISINVGNLYATDDLPEMLVDKIDEALRRRAITGRSQFAQELR